MEKKTENQVSRGAEKVENLEKKARREQTDAPAKAKSEKTVKAQATQKTAPKSRKKAEKTEKVAEKKLAQAEKAEKAHAEKRSKLAKARAEKKEKKLLKRAEIKEKRLQHKAEIAKKRAERKQKAMEKKAALKEKRLEKRAERIARREMLKNESRADKQKRHEREKKEKIALKRRRAESADKAREMKMKEREAKRARHAEQKKHKREQRTARKQHAPGFGGWLAAVISLGVACLALATVVTAGAFRMNDMTVASGNGYRATLYELVSVSEDMDDNLAKLRVSSGAEEQRKLLTDILVDSALMESSLERIPVDAATGTDISSFVNKTNSYARTLLKKIAAGEKLTQTEKNTIGYLYSVNSTLNRELNDLVMHMTEKDLQSFLDGHGGNVADKFGEMGQTSKRQPDEIVDAPFAGEGNVGENNLTAMDEITSAKAEELLKQYLEGYHVREVRYTGEAAMRDATCYTFVAMDENDLEIYAQISKNGGKLLFMDTYEECTQKNFDLESCDALAKKFLASIGIENVEAVWLSDGGMVADITYVSNVNGLRAYPDMVRVRVCESKGRVVGVEASGYFMNYRERDLEATLSEEEARSALSSDLQTEGGYLALIPVDDTETLAYEFLCTGDGEQYVVYLDAETGEEVQLFRVRNSARGSYLR